MSLSDNIKRLRHEKKLTQEELASKLGVSPQAVSKWETSETYPDGSLLVPLANELGVSLDVLFGNDSVYMADISEKIIKLFRDSEEKEQFNLARDICWQIERGFFNRYATIVNIYEADEINNQDKDSYILNDYGFTVVSNGKEPFFAVFPQPEEGFGEFLSDEEDLRQLFEVLADESTMKALLYLYRKPEKYVFESAVLEKDCVIPGDRMEEVLDNLCRMQIIRKLPMKINGTERVLYCSHPNHKIVAIFIMAKSLEYRGAYCLQSHNRNTPLIRE